MGVDYNKAQLKRLFRRYNRRYFNGELPDYRISFRRCLPYGLEGRAACDTPNQTLIFVPRQIPNRRQWQLTLLHEMSHILARPGHGGTFFDQVFRGPEYLIAYETRNDPFTLKVFRRRAVHCVGCTPFRSEVNNNESH